MVLIAELSKLGFADVDTLRAHVAAFVTRTHNKNAREVELDLTHKVMEIVGLFCFFHAWVGSGGRSGRSERAVHAHTHTEDTHTSPPSFRPPILRFCFTHAQRSLRGSRCPSSVVPRGWGAARPAFVEKIALVSFYFKKNLFLAACRCRCSCTTSCYATLCHHNSKQTARPPPPPPLVPLCHPTPTPAPAPSCAAALVALCHSIYLWKMYAFDF